MAAGLPSAFTVYRSSMADSSTQCSRTFAPASQSSQPVFSASTWLRPPMLGTKIMADRVALGRCRPRAPTDPSLKEFCVSRPPWRFLGHTLRASRRTGLLFGLSSLDLLGDNRPLRSLSRSSIPRRRQLLPRCPGPALLFRTAGLFQGCGEPI